MRLQFITRRLALCLLLVMSSLAFPACAKEHKAEQSAADRPLTLQEKKELATYRAKLAAYKKARKPYEKKASAYWRRIVSKRKHRRKKRARGHTIKLTDYVLDQPPEYSGPPKPVQPPFMRKKKKKKLRRGIPVVADFLRYSKKYFKFKPDMPKSEIEFKRAYAWAALSVGISREQAVRIYGFESSGNGHYNVQAGREKPGSKRPAISTALGYNQLLATNTLSLLANHGKVFLRAVDQMAKQAKGRDRQRMKEKYAKLKQMIAFSRRGRNNWYAHARLARTSKGRGVHALNLDVDIGPMLQVQKLLNSIHFARRGGNSRELAAAELEVMNLMGDGSGLDVVLMPHRMRDKVPTANFFQRRGYERNPIVIRNNVVSSLLTAMNRVMDKQMTLPGAKDMAAAFNAAIAARAEKNGGR
ncbi:MAG: hypothetical protein P8Y36_03670 [Alphaproteobacteria bacterium]